MLPLLILTALAAAPPKPALIPSATKTPVIDGDVRDVVPHLERKAPPAHHLGLVTQAANRKGVLYLAARVSDAHATDFSDVAFTLFFADAGVTATGYTFHVNGSGLATAPAAEEPELDTPSFALALAKAAVRKSPAGFDVELSIPARAMPRFPTVGPLALSVCAEYRRTPTGPAVTTCTASPDTALLPTDFRQRLGLKLPKDVVSLEGREKGWVGHARLHFINYVLADEPLTAGLLWALVDPAQRINPQQVHLPIPTDLKLPDGRPLFVVLTGTDPFVGDECRAADEVRMAWYAVKDRVALNVLEWPASSCTLGKAMRFDLSPEGNLAIGYTQGATTHFTWAGDHFERSELGKAVTTW